MNKSSKSDLNVKENSVETAYSNAEEAKNSSHFWFHQNSYLQRKRDKS